ncbi:putative PPE family protein PPE42 [Mycobacterium attenuatum]|nr:PPE domain-containing protein [Mycobacterium attenuatum]VBA56874.1 putative PPE family protein PPE42 [Mycobacterium attenuatum]
MTDFAILPPEINSARLYVGAGLAPMAEAAAAWEGLAAELDWATTAFSSVTSGLAGWSWQGAASAAMAEAATSYLGWLSLDPRMDWVRFGCRDEESAF